MPGRATAAVPQGLDLRSRQGLHAAARPSPERPGLLAVLLQQAPDLVAALNGQIDVDLAGKSTAARTLACATPAGPPETRFIKVADAQLYLLLGL